MKITSRHFHSSTGNSFGNKILIRKQEDKRKNLKLHFLRTFLLNRKSRLFYYYYTLFQNSIFRPKNQFWIFLFLVKIWILKNHQKSLIRVTHFLQTHCSKSSFLVQKFNFDFPRNCRFFLVEKLVKMLRFWTS